MRPPALGLLADAELRARFVRAGDALDQDLDRTAGFLAAEQPRRQHAGVVEHQQIAGRRSSTRSVKRRSSSRSRAASTTSRRLAERSASGACAISSGGRSKWKSDFFKSRDSGFGIRDGKATPVIERTQITIANLDSRIAASLTTTPSAAPAGTLRSDCRRRACRSPRTDSSAPCPATDSTARRCRRRKALRRRAAAPGARGR